MTQQFRSWVALERTETRRAHSARARALVAASALRSGADTPPTSVTRGTGTRKRCAHAIERYSALKRNEALDGNEPGKPDAKGKKPDTAGHAADTCVRVKRPEQVDPPSLGTGWRPPGAARGNWEQLQGVPGFFWG